MIDTLEKNRLCVPKTVRYGLVDETADKITRIFSSPSIPVHEIAETHGVNVIFDKMGQYQETIAGFCDFANARLYVNSEDATNRQTFTIAHELGHWLLHKDFFLEHPDEYPVLPRFQQRDNSNILEQEANRFAARLLMPDHLLAPVKSAPVSVLARLFSVSRQSMEIRLKSV